MLPILATVTLLSMVLLWDTQVNNIVVLTSDHLAEYGSDCCNVSWGSVGKCAVSKAHVAT